VKMRKLLGRVIMDEEEYELLTAKVKDLEDTVAKLIQGGRGNDRTVTILKDDLGNSLKRIEELKDELSKCRDEAERYKEEALRQIAEKKALYERSRKG